MFHKNVIRCGAAALLAVCLTANALLLPCTVDFPYAMTASAAVAAVKVGDLMYQLEDGEATVIDCDTAATEVVISEELQGYAVVGIGAGAFQDCVELTTVTIPDSVVSIGKDAFRGCSALTAIDLPDAVTSIPGYCFFECTALQRVTFGKQTTTIGEGALGKCQNLAAIELPESVTTIDIGAFIGCAQITSVVVPDTVTTIPAGCFGLCAALERVTLGKQTTTVSEQAFYGCQKLTAIELPESVTTIGSYAFGMSGLTAMDIPHSVINFGARVFCACPNLQTVTLPYAIQVIPDNTFVDCTALTSVHIPFATTTIAEAAFSGCTALQTIQYSGTQDAFNAIEIAADNACFTSAQTKRFFVGSIVTSPQDCTVEENQDAQFLLVTAGTIDTYQWQFSGDNGETWTNVPDVPTSATQIAIPATIANDGYLYRCKTTDCHNIVRYSKPARLTVQRKLAITQQTETVYVDRDATATFTVGASGDGLVYQWQYTKNNGASWGNLTGETTDTYSVKAVAARNGFCYRCRVTDQYGNKVFSQKAKLILKTEAAITQQPVNVRAARGAVATFSIEAVGDGLVYQWQYTKNNGASWGNLAGETTATYSVKAVAARNGFAYRCRVTDQYGNKAFSKKAKLTLKTETAILQQPSPVTAFRDTTAQFSVEAVGDDLVYQWQYTKDNGASWGNLTSETTDTYSVKATTARNGYCYRVRITDADGKKLFTQKVKLTVVSDTAILTQPEAALASVGTTATFSVEAVGKGLTYQWQYTKNNGASWGNLTGETTDTYSVKAVAARNGFCYRVRIMDADGNKVFSQKVQLTVASTAMIDTQPKNVLTTVGKTAAFSVAAYGDGLTYQWQYSKNGGETWGNLTGETTDSYSVKATAARNGFCYRVRVTDRAGNVVVSNLAFLVVLTSA